MAGPNYPDFTAMSDKEFSDFDTANWLSEYEQGLTSSSDFEEGGKHSDLIGQGQYYAPGVWSEYGTTTGIDWDNPDVLDQLISKEDIDVMGQEDKNALFQGTGKYEGFTLGVLGEGDIEAYSKDQNLNLVEEVTDEISKRSKDEFRRRNPVNRPKEDPIESEDADFDMNIDMEGNLTTLQDFEEYVPPEFEEEEEEEDIDAASDTTKRGPEMAAAFSEMGKLASKWGKSSAKRGFQYKTLSEMRGNRRG